MKHIIPLIVFVCCIFVGCNTKPTIQEVCKATEDGVRELLMENYSDEIQLRMDRYFLDTQADELTYTGALKATAFFKNPTWDSKKGIVVEVDDSISFYRTVKIKFFDKKYEEYSITIDTDED